MKILRTTIVFIGACLAAHAADFALEIGNPYAATSTSANTKMTKKGGILAVRSTGCADTVKVQIDGIAEGIVNGARQSIPLHLVEGSVPGASLVIQEWPSEGTWVVNLTGGCGKSKASAIVPVTSTGFNREQSKFYPRPAKNAEIEAMLKNLTGGGR